MKPDISEFSYGYALTEELIRSMRQQLSAAPTFPSLIEEGRPSGGYDVKLQFPFMPIFLQFKLSEHMKRRSAREFMLGLYTHPFYRFHLRPLRHSRQHDLLLDLESKSGPGVFYVAPSFHTVSELNRYYASGRVAEHSVFVRPSAIGALKDLEDHHVAHRPGEPAYFLSEPTRIEASNGSGFRGLLTDYSRSPGVGRITDEGTLLRLGEVMTSIARDRYSSADDPLARISELSSMRVIVYLAQVYFGSSVFMLRTPA